MCLRYLNNVDFYNLCEYFLKYKFFIISTIRGEYHRKLRLKQQINKKFLMEKYCKFKLDFTINCFHNFERCQCS